MCNNFHTVSYWMVKDDPKYYKKLLLRHVIVFFSVLLVSSVGGVYLDIRNYNNPASLLYGLSAFCVLVIIIHVYILLFRLTNEEMYIEINRSQVILKRGKYIEPEIIDMNELEKVYFQLGIIHFYLKTKHLRLLTKQKQFNAKTLDKKEIRAMVDYINEYISYNDKS